MDRAEWDARYAATDLLWSAEPNQFVEAEVADLPAGRMLDLAAGEGRNAIWLAENGWQATAVDFSRVALQKAAHLAVARGVDLDVVEADVTTYEPDAGAYDLVIVAYLQTGDAARDAWLTRAARAVAPGGTLLIVGHDRTNLDGGYGGPQDAAVLTTPDELAATLAASGDLVIEKAQTVERHVETADGPRVAIDHLVRARRLAGPNGSD
ncbi:MAG TPA: class I SAM-dependent methyltransferase [Acidimicrobiia bacterium]